GNDSLGRLVLGAVPAALSDVLGSAFGLSGVAFRRPSRTGGRSHHPEPARPAIHRYPDELHVSQRGVVVFLHADPVLCNLSTALLDGASRWAVVVFDNRVCRGIFRALRLAGALAAKRVVGPWRFRDLSITGVCARDVARNVAYATPKAFGAG